MFSQEQSLYQGTWLSTLHAILPLVNGSTSEEIIIQKQEFLWMFKWVKNRIIPILLSGFNFLAP